MPHWHPNAAELDYVVEGTAKMIILSPGGTVDSFKVKAGEIVFIPSGYLHYIESIDAEKYFNRPLNRSSELNCLTL